jgi:hypothetical protein
VLYHAVFYCDIIIIEVDDINFMKILFKTHGLVDTFAVMKVKIKALWVVATQCHNPEDHNLKMV